MFEKDRKRKVTSTEIRWHSSPYTLTTTTNKLAAKTLENTCFKNCLFRADFRCQANAYEKGLLEVEREALYQHPTKL